MKSTTRACDAPGCGLVATLTQLTPAVSSVSWPDGTTESLRGLPPNGTIRCAAHRAGSRHPHPCAHGFMHATNDAASTCKGHDRGGGDVPAFGLNPRGKGLK